MTDLHRNSKADTVLLLDAVASDLFVDLSQRRTSLAEDPDFLAESPSVRAAVAGDREIAVVCDIGPSTTGTLVFHGHPSGEPYTYRVIVVDDFGPVVQIYEAGELLTSARPPNLDSEPGPFLVHWSSKSTGAGTARSELLLVNLTAGDDVWAGDEHAAATPNLAHALYVGGVDGAALYSEGLAGIRSVRIGTRFHSTVEAREDWVEESDAPALVSETRLEPVPVDAGTDLAAEGVLYGPAILHAGHSATQVDKRLWSPLVSEVYRSTSPALSYLFAPTRHAVLAPGSDYLRLLLRHAWHRPLPPGCRRARARVHVTMWPASGTAVCSLQFQVWAWDVLPFTYKGVGPTPKSSATSVVTRTTNDGASDAAGGWVDLGNLSPPELNGLTWLALAVGFAGGDSDPALTHTRVRVNAVQIEPTYPSPLPGDFGFGD